ncbi:MAG: oligosaccharide flippase family protein [Planctomycetota bacterium]
MKRARRAAQGVLASRFLRESTTLQAASLIKAGCGLLSSVVLAVTLGALEQSVFYLATSAYALLWTLLNLGVGPIATMHIAKEARGGGGARLVGWMGVSLRISFGLALIGVALAGAVFGLLGAGALDGAAGLFDGEGLRVLGLSALLALSPLFEAPRNIFVAGLQGERRMLDVSRVEVGQEAARLAFVTFGALVTGDALGPTVGMLLGSLVGGALAFDAYGRARRAEDSHLPRVRDALRSREIRTGHAVREGVKVGLVRNVDSLGTETIPSLLVGQLGDRTWVTYLRIALRFGSLLRILVVGINRTALPALAALAHVKDVAALRRTYWRASLLSGATVTAGLALLVPLLPVPLRLLYPGDFQEPVYTLVLILVPGFAIASFSVANDVFYLVTQQLRVALVISAIGLAANVAITASCVVVWPRTGAAIGLSIACLWSLVHMGYAGQWLRRHAGVAAPGVAG